MIKHVCIRTHGPGGDDEWYITHEDQPEKGTIRHGTYFDSIEDAQALQARMKERWPMEKFQVFSVVER